MNTVELPSAIVQECKSRIWEMLRAPERKEVYADIIKTISHPMAVFRGRVVKGTRQLQYFINAIIVFRKLLLLLWLLILIIAVAYSWLILLLWIVLPLLNLVINHFQTCINIELAARLHVLDQLMDESTEFRRRVLANLEAQDNAIRRTR